MNRPEHAAPIAPDESTRRFYVEALSTLDRAGVPYAVGGGYAMAYYTGIARNTKDLDIFVRPHHRDRCLSVLAAAGYRTEFFFPFWIAKAIEPKTEAFIDILYNSGNGICVVDDDWFNYAKEIEVLGYRTRIVPAEEQLWSKAFVQDRDRYDGADVAHLILARGGKMDWKRLVRRFRGHERVLLSHLILFGYVYPQEKSCVPQWVTRQLLASLDQEPAPPEPVCQGTNLAQRGYLPDVQQWGYADGRLQPHGPLTEQELAQLPRE